MLIKYSNNTLIIQNEGKCKLDESSLVLGNSVKCEGAIGKFGEGYKLALLVLLRLNRKVIIKTGNRILTPIFEYSDTFKIEVLKIVIEEVKDYFDGISFEVENIGYSDIISLKSKSLKIAEHLDGTLYGKTINTDKGLILLDSKYKGKFYVEGLYIQTDSEFKFGYSFNADVVELDRDRMAINYYKLLELTSEVLVSQEKDFRIVETAISESYADGRRISSFFNDMSEKFAKGYAYEFIKAKEIEEDTFIGTKKQSVFANNKNKFITNELNARIINKGLGKEAEYLRVTELASNKDNKESAYKYYNDSALKTLIEWLCFNSGKLSVVQINNLIRIIKTLEKPQYFNTVEKDVFNNMIDKIKTKNKKYK